MPKKITNSETGEEEEVFTADEIAEREDAAKTAAIEQYKAEHPDNAEEIERLQDELKKANEDLEKEKGKDKNFSKLRDIKEDLEKKLAEATGGIKQEFMIRDLDTAISNLASGDDELAEKIKFHFNNTLKAVETKNQKELLEKVRQALTLAGGNEAGAGVGSNFGSGGIGNRRSKEAGGEELKPEVKEVLKKMDPSITDEDIKKYGGRALSTTE